jgi:TonB family protein
MNRFVLTSAICLSLLFGAQLSIAQDSSTTVVDVKNPPAGFVGPRAAEERDVSMAKYAPEAYVDGEEGIVDLRALVRQDGSVADAQVLTSSGSARLDQAAQEMVKGWRYVPATLNGTPVEASIPVQIIWALETLRFEMTREQAANLGSYYPLEAARRGDQGISTVRFLAGPDGSITRATIDKSSGNTRLDDAAVNMIKTGWRMTPTTPAPGATVGGWFRTNVAFVLPRRTPPRESGACGTAADVAGDARIRACTDFLSADMRTPFERAYAYIARGTAQAQKGAFDLALADFDAGMRASPGLADAYIARARVHLARGNNELAFADFDAAVQVEPLSYLIRMQRGSARHDAGQTEQGVADYDLAVRLAPAQYQPGALNDRCFFLARIGRAQEALADCDKSLSLRPRNANTMDTRAFAYFKLGQYQTAIREYDSALRLNPRMAVSLYARGVAKLKLGDRRGEADIGEAKKLDAGIERRMSQLGVVP